MNNADSSTLKNQNITSFNQLKTRLEGSGFQLEEVETSVYRFSTSVWIFILLSLVSIFIGLYNSIAGVFSSIVILFFLAKVLFQPTFIKFNNKKTRSLLLTIPARSKESQRLFLTTPLVNEEIIPYPNRMKQHSFLICLLMLAFLLICCHVTAYLVRTIYPLYFALIPIVSFIYLNISIAKEEKVVDTFQSSETLLEIISVLSKIRALTTTVTFCFLGARSQNSGINSILSRIKSGPEQTNIVNLISSKDGIPDKSLQIVNQEGALFSLKSDQILKELLTEVASEKNLEISESNFEKITETHLLLQQKLMAITILKPSVLTDYDQKKLRELILGLIRKLDH